MRSESRTPAARWAASKTDVQSGRGPPGSGASIGSRICSAACDERASARIRSCPREKGRFISGSYAETATRSAFLEASSISLLLPTPGSPSTTTALGRCSAGARASAARTTSSSCVRPKNPAIPVTVPVRLYVPLDPREVPHDTWERPRYRHSNARYRSVEGGEMRGFDCSDPSHGKIHFTGKDDDDLVQRVKAHAATAHPDLTEGQIREMIAGADWWKEMATSGANAGSAQSAYDE